MQVTIIILNKMSWLLDFNLLKCGMYHDCSTIVLTISSARLRTKQSICNFPHCSNSKQTSISDQTCSQVASRVEVHPAQLVLWTLSPSICKLVWLQGWRKGCTWEHFHQMFPTFTHWLHCEKDAHEPTMYSTCNHRFSGPFAPSVFFAWHWGMGGGHHVPEMRFLLLPLIREIPGA